MNYRYLNRWFGRCGRRGCNFRRVTEDRTVVTSYSHPLGFCPEHRTALHWQRLRGRHSASRECNDVCMAAVGPSCDCSCGGENHGKGKCQ